MRVHAKELAELVSTLLEILGAVYTPRILRAKAPRFQPFLRFWRQARPPPPPKTPAVSTLLEILVVHITIFGKEPFVASRFNPS